MNHESGDDAADAGEGWYQPDEPDHPDDRLDLDGKLGEDLGGNLEDERGGQVIKKDHQADAGKERNGAFRQMVLTSPLRGAVVFELHPPGLGLLPARGAARNILAHLIE